MKNKATILFCFLFLFCFSSIYSQSKKINTGVSSINSNANVQKQTLPSFISQNRGDDIDAPSGYLVEGFEGTFPPTDWQVINVLGPSYTWAKSTAQAHSGSSSAFIRYDAVSGGGQDWLISPKRGIVSGDSVVFWMRLAFQGYPPDSLSVKVSITDSAIASFNNTILLLREGVNYPPNATTWYRYAVSLNAFAGQNIFIAFKHVNVDGDGLYIDDVSIGAPPANDVGTVSIDNPVGISGAKFVPLATVKNFGSAANTFNVTMTSTGGYSSTKSVTTLAPGSSIQVVFDSLDASVAGPHPLTAYTQLATDQDRTNDTARKTVTSYLTYTYNNSPWMNGTALPSARWAHASVFYSVNDTGYVYMISGADGTFANTATVDRYNFVTGVWTSVAPITVARTQISGVATKGKIYVPGGYTGSFAPVNTLSIYDIATNTWSVGAVMTQAVGDYAIGLYGDSLIYVVGGYSGAADVNLVQIYNVNTNTWSAGTPKLGTATAGLRGGIVDNKIIIVGGYSQTLARETDEVVIGTIDISNPNTITWAASSTYPGGTVGRFASGVPAITHVATDQLSPRYVVFAGGDPTGQGTTAKSDSWAYDFMTSQWKVGPTMLAGVSNVSQLAGVLSKDTVYMYIGGGYNGTSIVTNFQYQNLGAEAQLPVELSSFTSSVNKNDVVLNWSTVSEVNNHKFVIERKSTGSWTSVGEVTGNGTTNEVKSYSFNDRNLTSGSYYYRLKQIDYNGNFEYHNLVNEVIVGVPNAFALSQNYPNPFNPSTKIDFALPVDSRVSIKIYDMLGKEAAVIMNNEARTAGYYSVQFNGSSLSSGIYFYAIKTEGQQNFSITRKMVLVK